MKPQPNLQNVPIRTELGQLIRRALIPTTPRLLDVDYAQLEQRMETKRR